MIHKKYVAFTLSEAMTGISNEGSQYSDDTFTLDKDMKGVFNSLSECEQYIMDSLSDMNNRGVKNVRYSIVQVFFSDNDKIFSV